MEWLSCFKSVYAKRKTDKKKTKKTGEEQKKQTAWKKSKKKKSLPEICLAALKRWQCALQRGDNRHWERGGRWGEVDMSQHVAWGQKAVALERRGGILMTQKLAQQVWMGWNVTQTPPSSSSNNLQRRTEEKVPLLLIISYLPHQLTLLFFIETDTFYKACCLLWGSAPRSPVLFLLKLKYTGWFLLVSVYVHPCVSFPFSPWLEPVCVADCHTPSKCCDSTVFLSQSGPMLRLSNLPPLF